jgi:chromate transporter
LGVEHLRELALLFLRLGATTFGGPAAVPGPLSSVATFIGYLLDGFPGAIAATLGVFLPAFLLVAVSGPLVDRIRRSPALSAFLDGVVAASLSLMAVVAFELAKGSLVDPGSLVILLVSAVALCGSASLRAG